MFKALKKFIVGLTHHFFCPPLPEGKRASDFMYKGIRLFPETMSFEACALGTAYRTKTGRSLKTDAINAGIFTHSHVCGIAAEALNIPKDLAIQVSGMHCMFLATRRGCAEFLAKKGY